MLLVLPSRVFRTFIPSQDIQAQETTALNLHRSAAVVPWADIVSQ